MRLIDADALVEDIGNEINKKTKVILLADYNHYYCSGMRNAIRLVKRLPTVEPVKHGRWIEGCPTETTDYFNCSVCNAGIFVNNLWRVSYKDVSEIHKFCLNCGARMDEAEE